MYVQRNFGIWNEKDLDKVLKKLKNGKCQDPAGLVNELFKLEI